MPLRLLIYDEIFKCFFLFFVHCIVHDNDYLLIFLVFYVFELLLIDVDIVDRVEDEFSLLISEVCL